MGLIKRGGLGLVVVVACSWPVEAFAGGLLQPSDYTAIAPTLTETGNYSVNTSGSTPTITLPDGTVLNGVLDPTGQIAVFTFGSINIGPGVNSVMTVTGSNAVAILSQGNFTISNEFQVSVSAPDNGTGPGGYAVGGPGAGSSTMASGGGGGYGGLGGAGGEGYYTDSGRTVPGGAGGSTYGLTTAGLIGGSAGSGAGGGGAIEFGAGKTMSLSGLNVSANGGNDTYYQAGFGGNSGGGGSGGEVAFLGSSVSLNVVVTAQGGIGGVPFNPMYGDFLQGGYGGSGGGGLVQIQSNNISLDPSTFNLQGGGSGAGSGGISEFDSNGVFTGFLATPEPSSIVMAGIAAAAGLATALGRRHRRRRASQQRSIT